LSKKQKTTKQVVVVNPPIKKRLGKMGLGEMRLGETRLGEMLHNPVGYAGVLTKPVLTKQ